MRDAEVYFPPDLLKGSPEERKRYFKEYEVLHPRLQLIFNRVLRIVREKGGIQLIFIIGGTGVGKSFLLKWLVSEIEYEWSLIQHTNPGRIPVAWIEVPAKDTKNPTWGDYYIRVLEALAERHIDKKIYYADVAISVQHIDGRRKVVVENATIRKLRRATESCFDHRDPIIFFLDEAHQLINTGGLIVKEQVENLKSVANMTKALHGLLGTYKMLDLLCLDDEEESDQLIRRSAILHFRRYRNTPEERYVFDSIVNSFQVNMPFHKLPNLIEHSEYIYERTLGCVGILRDWLVAAYTEAVNEGANTLGLKHLKSTCLISKSRSEKMLKQFITSEGNLEKILDIDDDEFVDFIKMSGIEKPTDQTTYSAKNDERLQKLEKHRPRGQRKPGKQNPKRRRIG